MFVLEILYCQQLFFFFKVHSGLAQQNFLLSTSAHESWMDVACLCLCGNCPLTAGPYSRHLFREATLV